MAAGSVLFIHNRLACVRQRVGPCMLPADMDVGRAVFRGPGGRLDFLTSSAAFPDRRQSTAPMTAGSIVQVASGSKCFQVVDTAENEDFAQQSSLARPVILHSPGRLPLLRP